MVKGAFSFANPSFIVCEPNWSTNALLPLSSSLFMYSLFACKFFIVFCIASLLSDIFNYYFFLFIIFKKIFLFIRFIFFGGIYAKLLFVFCLFMKIWKNKIVFAYLLRLGKINIKLKKLAAFLLLYSLLCFLPHRETISLWVFEDPFLFLPYFWPL